MQSYLNVKKLRNHVRNIRCKISFLINSSNLRHFKMNNQIQTWHSDSGGIDATINLHLLVLYILYNLPIPN